jgi:translation elongation factor P/translation initiation factor 5A
MKKQAKDLKKGEKIILANQSCEIISFELSDIGKQGKRKVRIEVSTPKNEKIVIIRPEDYLFETA